MATFSSLPKGWEVMKLYGCFTESTAKNSSLSFTRAMQFNYGRIVDKNESFETDEVKDIYAKYSLVKKGDIVINGLNLNYDVVSQRVAIVPKDGIITSAYIVLRPREGIYPEFFCYLFKALDSRKIFHGMGTGIRLTLSFKELKNMPIPLPPLPKQKAIVAYLDAETGRIDKAIAAEEKMIALLQERREIVINEAVGGGDLSHAEAQRGRERRGWNVKPWNGIFENLDYLRKPITADQRPRANPQYDYYGASGVIDKIDYYNVDDTVLLIAEDGANLVLRNLPLVYKTKGKVWINNHAHILKPRVDNYDFLAYLLESYDYTQLITGSAQPKLSQGQLATIRLAIPPLPEQEAIVERLDRETGKIDRAIEVKRRQIELLRERRQIVIDEVVTGKVKVA